MYIKLLFLILWVGFYLIYLYLFMYQRVALNLERLNDISRQVYLPKWFSKFSNLVFIILVILLILIGIYWNWYLSIGLFISCMLIITFIPIPENYFMKKIKKNLKELKKDQGIN